MRRFSFALLALLLVSLSAGIRDVQAGPTHEVWDTFYDCALNENGWLLHTCGGSHQQGGTLAGDYRLRETFHCQTSAYAYQWYYWNGTGWTAFSGPPGPNC